jgi:hypothetical protein
MIRSIAYELFDRLTTDPDALRKKLADANYALESLRETKLFSEELMAECDALQLQVRELQATTCKVTITSDTIEPTWILALWSIHAEGWTEDKRGSYDSMLGEMRKTAMPWQLFPRSQWDALVKNGRAR